MNDDIFTTPPPSHKQTLGDTGLGDNEDENTKPGLSQRAHPLKWPHTADSQHHF